MPIVVLDSVKTPLANPADLWNTILQHKRNAMDFSTSMYALAQKEQDPSNKALLSEIATKTLLKTFGGKDGVPDMGKNYITHRDRETEHRDNTIKEHLYLAQNYLQEQGKWAPFVQKSLSDPQHQQKIQDITNELQSANVPPATIQNIIDSYNQAKLNQDLFQHYKANPTPNEYWDELTREPGTNFGNTYSEYHDRNLYSLPLEIDWLKQMRTP